MTKPIAFDECARLAAPGDNVAIAVRRLERGTDILHDGRTLRLSDTILEAHRSALTAREIEQVRPEDQVDLRIHQDKVFAVLQCGNGKTESGANAVRGFEKDIHAVATGNDVAVVAHRDVFLGDCVVGFVSSVDNAKRNVEGPEPVGAAIELAIGDGHAADAGRDRTLVDEAFAHRPDADDADADISVQIS